MTHRMGEPGEPGELGEPGVHGGGRGGTGGTGGRGGEGATAQQTRALVSLLLFALVLAAANFLFTAQAIHRAQANTANLTQLCESGNTFRAEQVQLWAFLVAISKPPPHETPAEKAQRQKTTRLFIAHIHRVFAPRNCHKEE